MHHGIGHMIGYLPLDIPCPLPWHALDKDQPLPTETYPTPPLLDIPYPLSGHTLTPSASYIWWSSLETCSNLFTWGPTSPPVLTSSDGHRYTHSWQAGGRVILELSCVLCKWAIKVLFLLNGLFTLPDSDSDSDSDYCTMQKFPIDLDSDSDPLTAI